MNNCVKPYTLGKLPFSREQHEEQRRRKWRGASAKRASVVGFSRFEMFFEGFFQFWIHVALMGFRQIFAVMFFFCFEF